MNALFPGSEAHRHDQRGKANTGAVFFRPECAKARKKSLIFDELFCTYFGYGNCWIAYQRVVCRTSFHRHADSSRRDYKGSQNGQRSTLRSLAICTYSERTYPFVTADLHINRFVHIACSQRPGKCRYCPEPFPARVLLNWSCYISIRLLR